MSNGDETIKEYKLRSDTIIIAGSAKLPDGTTAKHAFGSITIELEVDPVDTKIVDVSCTLLPFLGEKLIHTVLLGSKVDEGIRDAIEQLKKRFFSPTQRAVIAALEDVYNKWCNI